MKIYSGKRSKKNTVSKFVSTELETGEEIVLDERSTKSPLVLLSDLALVKSILVTPAHKLDMEQFHSHDWAADIYPQSHRIMELVCPNFALCHRIPLIKVTSQEGRFDSEWKAGADRKDGMMQTEGKHSK